LIFLLGIIGTAVTVLRLRMVIELHAIYLHKPGSVRWFVVAANVMLLTEIECSIILICANLPALTPWMKRRNNTDVNDAVAPGNAPATADCAERSSTAAALELPLPWWLRGFMRQASRQ
jgi:hypothetical protein